jgi:uncharacterized protein
MKKKKTTNDITNTGLPLLLLKEMKSIFASNPKIEKIILFGSRAMGNFREGSDIDLAIVSTNLTLNDKLEISLKLEDLGYPYSYDLLFLNQNTDPDILDHIKKFGRMLYKKNK